MFGKKIDIFGLKPQKGGKKRKGGTACFLLFGMSDMQNKKLNSSVGGKKEGQQKLPASPEGKKEEGGGGASLIPFPTLAKTVKKGGKGFGRHYIRRKRRDEEKEGGEV